MSSPFFLTAAAGHRAEARHLERKLTWWDRFLIRHLFNAPNAHALLQERFRAQVLQRWGLALEDAEQRSISLDT